MTKQPKVLYGVIGLVVLAIIGGVACSPTGGSPTESTVGLLGTDAAVSTTSITQATTASSSSTTATAASTVTTRLSTATTKVTLTTGASTTTSEVTSTTAAQSGDVTVYITKTGKKYHRASCSSLSKSRIPISLAEAKARGYEPCKLCDPPQ